MPGALDARELRPADPRDAADDGRRDAPDLAGDDGARARSGVRAVSDARPVGRCAGLIERAIARQLPGLTAFFGRALELNPELHFLTYRAGGFIRPHRDVLEGDHVLEKIRERVVVFTLFLNGADGPGADTFGGGDFVLHPAPSGDW